MTEKMYNFRKARNILQTGYTWYKKKSKSLTKSELESLEKDLAELNRALSEKDPIRANDAARKVESFGAIHFKKTFFDYSLELIFALVFALVIATIVRSMWFEPYEIPTGSMRPTFKEQDHLTVSKLAFGINIPLMTKHFYFDPNLVQRMGIVTFSGDKIPVIDADTTYFMLFPAKKRYIKRCIGKPGDIFYFYGGKLYALDEQGNFLSEFLDSPWMKNLEHIPFLSFEGRISLQNNNSFLLNQMNVPIGRISVSSSGTVAGEIFNGKEWIKDEPTVQPHQQIQTYSDFWGFKNYAMVRLLTKQQLQEDTDLKGVEDGVLFLEIRHTPSLNFPQPRLQGDRRGFGILLTPFKTVIPLQQHHLDAIMDNMYTARFVVNDGRARRYSLEDSKNIGFGNPRFTGVPDGTYEFYYGKAAKVGFGGITSALPSDHPLYKRTPENIQKLFNLGIEMDLAYAPHPLNQSLYPARYAYFREGDLYLLGAPIFLKDDPVLKSFLKREQTKQQKASASRPYIAFKDYGPPIKEDGSIDKEFIRTFGIKIPEGRYMVLGDNHAMSADSRIFGPIPEANLQGAPSLIVWPPGDRLGCPMQKPYPIFNVPRLIIWSIALLIAVVWYILHRRRLRNIPF